MMKFFPLDYVNSELTLEDSATRAIRAWREYNQYLSGIMDKLPAELVRLHQTVHVGDAGVRELRVDLTGRCVQVVLDAEDFESREWRPVRLHYEQVREVISTVTPDKGVGGIPGYGDLLNDEIEMLEEGLYEHRWAFSSGIEIAFRFGAFWFEEMPQDIDPPTVL